MIIRKFLTAILVCLCSVLSLAGQSRFSSVSALMDSFPKDSCVTADYSLTVNAPKNAKIAYNGRLWWQDGLFRVEGDGYRILCDGLHIWTVDSVAKEVVREEAVTVEELIPVSGTQSSDSFSVETPSDGNGVSRISFTMKNGASVEIEVPSLSLTGAVDRSFFTFDLNSVPDDYVITILD